MMSLGPVFNSSNGSAPLSGRQQRFIAAVRGAREQQQRFSAAGVGWFTAAVARRV
jgi:hypothetical protein